MSLPKAISIDKGAFVGCTSLESVFLPKVATIDESVFGYTGGKSLVITLGDPAPTVGINIFRNTAGKSVTVRIPLSATGYGLTPADAATPNWGNAFRGKGRTETMYLAGNVNPNITLRIDTMSGS
jgi:hypothetical protein